MKVLIVDDDAALTFFLREIVDSCGHDPIEACDGKSGYDIFLREKPDIVISDLRMPRMDGLQFLRLVREKDPQTIFIILTGQGSEEEARSALELHANNYLIKPIRFETVVSLLEKYEDVLRARTVHEEVGRLIIRREFSLELGNRIDLLSDVADFLVKETEGVLSPDQQFEVHLGLYELLVNAIEHGNLGVTYEEKQTALMEGGHRHAELVRRRGEEPHRAVRKVIVEFRMLGGRFEWLIQDEGEGFDWNAVPNPLSPDGQEHINGRGIFLARFQFDELIYLGNGSRVRAVKFFKQR